MMEEGETAAQQQQQQQQQSGQPLMHVPFCGHPSPCHASPEHICGQHSLTVSPLAEVLEDDVGVVPLFAFACYFACYHSAV